MKIPTPQPHLYWKYLPFSASEQFAVVKAAPNTACFGWRKHILLALLIVAANPSGEIALPN